MPIATPQGTLDFKSVDTITFVGASSNTVIDTTTGSLGVGVDVNGPTSNLHVVGDALITGNVADLNVVSNVNMLHTSNTASIKLNSNVVVEFPRSKKLIKYPRVALTANSDSGYLVDASTRLDNTGWAPYRAFNTIVGAEDGWHDEGGTYSNGVYTGTNSVTPVTGTAVSGEWIEIQLPEKIKLEKVRLGPRSTYTYRMPEDATILGSINGTDWYRVTSWSGQTYISGNNYITINVDSEQYYNYYVLVVEALEAVSGGNSVNIGEWELYGTPEYDPEAHGVDVVVKSLPNVPNTDWLEVYYDAKGLATGAVTTVNDLKPSSLGSAINSSSVTNVSVSDESFVFNGASSGINATLSNPQGAWSHSTSVWIKLGKDHSDYNGDNVFSIGNVAGTAQLESLRIHSNDVRFITFSTSEVTYPLPMERDRWYHFTLIYDGGATGNSFRLFRDGVEYTGTSGTVVEMNLAANSLLSVGYERVRNQSHFNGSIANFRIFNRALTQDEIYQLYAYQKEYFGHGDLSMTLKAGRLGIGTSEPRAALDVRGDTFSTVFKGGRPTFLAWDYLGQRSTNFSAASSSITQVAILDHTFDIPSCYHHLGTANLKAYVKIDWRGESEKSWNFGFRVELSGKTGTGVDFVTQSSQSDNASALGNKINGLTCISYHAENFDSTPTAASVTSMFSLPNCDVSSGSKLKVNLIGKYGDNVATVLWTGRTKGFSNALSHELPTNSFFVILDVEDGY